MKLTKLLQILVTVGLFAPWGAAQAPPPAPPPNSDVKITVNWRSRLESWDFFSTPTRDGQYTFGASLLQIGLSQNLRKLDWRVDVAQPILLGLPADAIAPAPQGQLGLGATYFAANGGNSSVAGFFPRQAFIRFKGSLGEGSDSLKLGRFEFIDGTERIPKDATLASLKRERIAHRLIGNFGFSHVPRSFDAAQLSFDTAATNTTVFFGRPTNGVFDVHGLRELDVDVLYGSHTRSLGHKAPGEVRVFALSYHDGRRALKTDNRSAASRTADTHNIRITTLGAHLLYVVPVGKAKADFLAWGAVQGGSWGVQTQRASAFAVEAGYQPKLWTLNPWIRIGHSYSSGDSNTNDGRHGTFFQVLPTPRIYARFPFYNLMNNVDDFVELAVRPNPRWAIRSDFHTLRLSNSHDLWYLGGGAYQQKIFGYVGRPSNQHQALANLVDVSADYKISKEWSATAYAAHANGQSVVSALFPTQKDANLYYVELSWNMAHSLFGGGGK